MQSRAAQRLSSGFRINSAADDAAGLGISEKMRGQIRGLDQASRNAQDGISLIQTAEGAMGTINEMVIRIRELVVQAANDTNVHDDDDAATWSQSDRTRIQDEINQLLLEIDATVKRTEFNTRTLLDGSLSGTGNGGGGVGPFTGPAMDAFDSDAIGFTANGFDLLVEGDLAEGFTLADDKTMADVNSAFQAALTTLISGATPGANESYGQSQWDGQVTAWLAAPGASGTGTGAAVTGGITNLAGLFADTSTTGAAFEAKELLMSALNGVDLSELIVGPTASGTAAPFSGGPITFGDITIANTTATSIGDITFDTDMFKFVDDSNTATDLTDAINTALSELFGGSSASTFNAVGVALWLDGTTSTAGVTNPVATIDMQGEFATDTLAGILAWGDNPPAVGTGGASIANMQSVYDAVVGAIEGVLQDMLEPIDNGNGNNDGSGQGLWFQVGANVNQGVTLQIKNVNVNALSEVGAASSPRNKSFMDLWAGTIPTAVNGETYLAVNGANTQFYETVPANLQRGILNSRGQEIQAFITAIDFALSHVTSERSNLGAMQNRLEYTIENLDVSSENLQAAESRIRDADMAKEMMRFTQSNVLQQAAISMLAQANQAPQSILQLLG
jgi:flagellin